MAHLEISGNFDLALDGLSVDRLEISGLGVDWGLDDLLVARLEFSGLNCMSSTHGTVVF